MKLAEKILSMFEASVDIEKEIKSVIADIKSLDSLKSITKRFWVLDSEEKPRKVSKTFAFDLDVLLSQKEAASIMSDIKKISSLKSLMKMLDLHSIDKLSVELINDHRIANPSHVDTKQKQPEYAYGHFSKFEVKALVGGHDKVFRFVVSYRIDKNKNK